MLKICYLLFILNLISAYANNEEKQKGFVQPLDFSPIFGSNNEGISSLSSKPIAGAVLKVDKSLYPKLFDTAVSSSIDSLQSRVTPKENQFSAEYFGFNPIASQSFYPPLKLAKVVAQPRPVQQQSFNQKQPLQYDIHTIHDANYKVYKPEIQEQEGEEILSALKKNPSVAAYFKPAATNVEVSHPLNYRKEELVENPVHEQNYRNNPYLTGPVRIRRYTGGRKQEKLRKSSEEEDDPYGYKAEYISRPKAFDSEHYSSPYKQAKNKDDEYEYPYSYDSGYDHKEYERIKELSEKQAAEIKQNPGNCKEVNKDGMTCMTCKDPKTGGNYESCSYVAEPKNNQYAYSKEKKFDSNDEPDEPENEEKSEQPKLAKYEASSESQPSEKYVTDSAEKPYSSYKKEQDKDNDSGEKYKSYYVHSSKPTPSEALRAGNKDDSGERAEDRPYDYKQAIPGFYSDNEQKKDVEHVLAEFKKKDRSACKKVQKNGMTCYQCTDKNGLKHEECMFVSESAPKRSHLAYQELKEFTSRPETVATNEAGNVGAESQTVTTSSPIAQKSAAYVVATDGYGKKLKRKKATQIASANSPIISSVLPVALPTQQLLKSIKTKRSVAPEAEEQADEANIAPPEEFAGVDSKGAFWSETQPRYSPALGVTLPEFMLSRSEHEISFDEAVANA